MRKKIVAALLLIAILAFGASLRIVGHNWDDFTNTHPDELFLTLLVLPQIGGANSFTENSAHFPDQQILVLEDNIAGGRVDALTDSSAALIGAIRDSSSADAAKLLASDDRVRYFESHTEAQNALRARQIDALIVDQRQTADVGIIRSDALTSTTLQSLHCQQLYPASNGVGGWFDTRCSPYNPHNAGHGFYVYGTLPMFMAHFASEVIESATDAGLPLFHYQSGQLVWRGLSAIFDILTILVVFAIGTRMHNRWVGLLAALFYACAPLAIQKAHFGTVNAITSFFVALALYYAVSVQQRGKAGIYLLFGLACGAAVASRINVAPLAGVIVLAACLRAMPIFDARLSGKDRNQLILRHVLGLLLAGLGAFLAFRVLNPYAFSGPGFFDILPNSRWLENLSSASAGVGGAQDSPPNWQWLARSSFIHPFTDMLLWTMSMSFGVLGWFGLLWAAYRLLRMRKGATGSLILVAWVVAYFLWMSRLWGMPSRYYLPLYSALAVFAGWTLYEFYRYARTHGRSLAITSLPMIAMGGLLSAVGVYQITHGTIDATALTALIVGVILLVTALLPRFSRWRPLILGGFAVVFSLAWALMQSNIYRHQTTWVQASRYIFERVPGDFSMAIDGSDESLPLINIAVGNTGVALPDMSSKILDQATHYREGQATSIVFTAPASGAISSIFAPHLADPFDDPEAEELSLRVFAAGASEPLAEAILRANFSRAGHPLGASYTIPFQAPLRVEQGATYSFVVEVARGSGDVIGSGSLVYAEGDWDTRITGVQVCQLPDGLTLADNPPSGLVSGRDCRGERPYQSLVNAQDQTMSFPVDNPGKVDDILRSLENGDYFTIATNRFYDSEARNPMRWPLTTLYYEKLFAGELGFELERIFDEPFEFGPWRVSDQHLPIYASPAWLNELEADESFHVYDHPAVFIFRKTADYSQARVEAIFSQASTRQAHELGNGGDQAQFLGVFYWTSLEADRAPTALTFPAEQDEIQSAGGTWSERFFSDAIVNTSQPTGVILWYAAIFIFGVCAFPLMFSLFPRMADGGYGFSKLIGLLLVAWLAWAVSSLKIPIWSQAGILLSLIVMTSLSAWLGYRNRLSLAGFLRNNWKRLAWMEVIAIILFLFMIVVRLTNPDLWHVGKGGEKPMDFAYLNGVLRSTTFPPIDPWFSGGFINYYYFGYVLLGAPTLLLGVVPSFAYNLMIPTVFSLTGLGAFSAAFNILSRWRDTNDNRARKSLQPRRRLGNPWVAGFMALLLCVVLGNLDTARVLGNGVAALGGYRTPEGLEYFLVDEHVAETGQEAEPEAHLGLRLRANELHLTDSLRYEFHNSVSLVGGMIRGFGRLLSGDSLPIGHDRWYWGPSRVLAETPGVRGGAITEMPYFTFLYGDLHAHMISMPLILFAVLFLFNELAQAGCDRRKKIERALAIGLGALAVGLLQATNTWDWPSMTLFAVVGLAYVWCLRWKHTFRPLRELRFTIIALAAPLAAALILTIITPTLEAGFLENVLPLANLAQILRAVLLIFSALILLFYAIRHLLVRASTLDFLAQVGGFMLLNFAFALPYTSWYAATYNSVRLWQDGKTPLWAYFDIHGLFLFLVVSLLVWDTVHWLRATRVSALVDKQAALKSAAGAGVLVSLLTMAMTLVGYQVALIVLPLVCWIVLLFFRSGQSRAMRFVLVLIGLALSMTMGVEIVVVGGDIGRQNTVFKFYMQVWLLLSIAGGIAFANILRASHQFSRSLRIIWFTPCIILVFIAALFPIMGTRARSLDRMAPDLPLTLNGADYMTLSRLHENSSQHGTGAVIDLAVDHQLMRWLQENVSGSPVIMEGHERPSEYQWNGRFSITTGLPSVLGWNFHQRQQRTLASMSRWIDQREQNVMQFYNTSDIDIAVDIIHHFAVKYVIESGFEKVHSTPEGLEKFERMVERGLLTVAFAVEGGQIYQVNEDALLQYLVERNS